VDNIVLAGIFGTVAKKTSPIYRLLKCWTPDLFWWGGHYTFLVQQIGSNVSFPNNVQNGNLTANTLLLPKAVFLDFEVVITCAKLHFVGLPTDLRIDCKLTRAESCY